MDHHRAHNAEEVGPGFWRHRHVHQHESPLDWHHDPGPPFKGRFDDHEHPHYRSDDLDGDHHDPRPDHDDDASAAADDHPA